MAKARGRGRPKRRIRKSQAKANPGRRGLKPGQTHAATYKPGQSGNLHRGPDTVPRKPVVRLVQQQALMQTQLRTASGRLSSSKWAKPVHAAGMRDFIRAHTRLLYAIAHLEPEHAAALASAVTRTGEYFAAVLDGQTAAAAAPRVTTFVFADQRGGSVEAPKLQPGLGPGAPPDKYTDVREEDAR